MNRFFRTLIMLVTACAATGIAYSQDSSVNIGYCAGEVSSTGALTVEGKTWVSGAIYLPSSMLQPYDGLQISKVRAGIASRLNIDSVRVWVRQQLDGANMGEGLITTKTTPKIKTGWNEVDLETPVTISYSEGLYVGFSYHQKTATGAFSCIGSALANAFFGQLSPEGDWQDLCSYGILSVEATVEGATLQDYDLGIISASYCQSEVSSLNRLNVTISNVGQKDVSGFTLEAAYSGTDELYQQHFDTLLNAGTNIELSYTIPVCSSNEDHDLVVRLVGIDDGEDAMTENNSMTARLIYQRKVLVEEYTTERCSNCPRVAGYLQEIIERENYKDKIVAVCHHAGYYTDWLTQDCDKELVSSNGFNISYAPAMAFDRAPLFSGSTHTTPDYETITTSVDTRLEVEPHAMLSFDASYDASTRKLHVVVNGLRNEVFTNNPVRLTVYITEDSIPCRAQSGADASYVQEHVIRAYNSTWGDVITWDLNRFSMDYTFDIQSGWQSRNLKVIAFIASHNSTDVTDRVVENVESYSLDDTLSSIRAICNDYESSSPHYYTLDGKRLNGRPAASGLYILLKKLSDGTARSQKVFIR